MDAAPAVSTTPTAIDGETQAEFVAAHAGALKRQPFIHAGLALGLGLLVWPWVSGPEFARWAAPMLLIETGRAAFAQRLLRRRGGMPVRRVHGQFIALAALAGLSTGLAGWWFFPVLPLEHQALLGAVLYAIPAAGVAVSQSSRWVLGAYAIDIFLPVYVRWAMLHPQHAVALGALTVVYAAVLIWVAADTEALLRRAIAIRHERDDLVRQLEWRNAAVSDALRRAEQAAQSRAEVLAAASHDLRQPLHALSLYSAVLGTDPPAALRQEAAQHIGQTVLALDGLLSGLLDLSRLNSATVPLHLTAVDLAQVLAPLCSEAAARAQAKGLQLLCELNPVWAHTDALAVERIVRNLIDNALKYTERGAIRVQISPQEQRAAITVHDSGCGIAPAEQRRIFEEFYQVNNPGRDRSQGVGLGLAIVERLCEHIGATVQVQSALGQGATFRVLLPAAQPPQDAQAAGDQAAPPSRLPHDELAGMRVLLIDDEIDIRLATAALLRAWGVVVDGADGPVQAQALCLQGRARGDPPYDCALADWRLAAGADGLQLAQALHHQGLVRHVVLLSGDANRLRGLAQPLGGGALRAALGKPLAAQALYQALRACQTPSP